MTSRNKPMRTYLLLKILQWRGVYNHSHSLKFCQGSSLLTSLLTVHLQCVYSRQRIHTYSFMGSRIRDSAKAVHEAASTLGFTLKKAQEIAFTQGHDAFVALSTGFGNSCFCCCLPYVFAKIRGFTNVSIAVVLSRGGEW